MPPSRRSTVAPSRTSSRSPCSTGWSWRARPGQAPFAARCSSPSARAATASKEIIDFHLATAESAAQWEHFLADLDLRGLCESTLEMICVDGGSGLIAALPTVFPDVRIQRCWAHMFRNVLAKVRLSDQAAVKADLHAIMNAKSLPQARSAARRFADA